MTGRMPPCMDPNEPCLWDDESDSCPCEDPDPEPEPERPIETVPTGSYL